MVPPSITNSPPWIEAAWSEARKATSRLRRRGLGFWLWWSTTRDSTDRDRHLSPNAVTPALNGDEGFRSDPSRQPCKSFELGLIQDGTPQSPITRGYSTV